MAGYWSVGAGPYAVFTGVDARFSGVSAVAANNATVDDMGSWSVQAGGSGKAIAGMSAEWVIGRNASGDPWHGISIGGSGGYGFELHGRLTRSSQIYRSQ